MCTRGVQSPSSLPPFLQPRGPESLQDQCRRSAGVGTWQLRRLPREETAPQAASNVVVSYDSNSMDALETGGEAARQVRSSHAGSSTTANSTTPRRHRPAAAVVAAAAAAAAAAAEQQSSRAAGQLTSPPSPSAYSSVRYLAWRLAIDATRLESSPPESSTPHGTSDIMRFTTAFSN